MSQNDPNNLPSALKRSRETMSGFGTGIPQLASAVKRPAIGTNSGPGGPRQSLAGGRLSMAPPARSGLPRSSSGGEQAPMSTVKRNSIRNSMAPPGSQGPSSQRRSSQFVGRPSNSQQNPASFMTVTKASLVKDSRPLKNPQFKQRLAAELHEFLIGNNFEMDMKYQLQPNAMMSPTQKDFYQVFQWLYKRFDPDYPFGQQKQEAEVIPCLNNLRYPYANTITKTQLTAVGSGNTWPTLLGALHWMMCLAEGTDDMLNGNFDYAAEEAGAQPFAPEKIVFTYIAKSYASFLDNNDDDAEHAEEMRRAFEARNEGVLAELAEYEEENQRLKKELEDLDESHQPLQKLLETRTVLSEDAKKFEVFIEANLLKINRQAETIDKIKQEVATVEKQLQQTEQEKQSLEAKVNAQGFTPADLDRINAEEERHRTALQQMAARLAGIHEKLITHETAAEEKLSQLEDAVSRYNALAYKIGIIPSTAPKAQGQDFEAQIIPLTRPVTPGVPRLLSESGYAPSQLLNLDLRNVVKPYLEVLKRDLTQENEAATDEAFRTADHIERITEALRDETDELETLEMMVRTTINEHQEVKDNRQRELNVANADHERMSAELREMRMQMKNGVIEAKQVSQESVVVYGKMCSGIDQYRTQLHENVVSIIKDIVSYKINIQQNLETFEMEVEDYVKKSEQ
ncbi:Similar to Probable kinetochore protein ndc80; acc. no. Q5B3B1 [Pyronema omphalodes CBS 100304]|uniref:Kinetochore protein NDC80 n=1 Tax=Pyronema omphalodes (strain CBS 100304) TaxID=1076935 RepID=U4L7A7_PYROM|nr:Similar to Probable kinetochore protein ndc80; acc. no. Q5B3B1 [Pyronema omphalodes CBS 100304]